MVLVDTHIWLWFLVGDRRLRGRLRDLLLTRPSEVFLSSVSIWEAACLGTQGSVDFGNEPLAFLRGKVSESEFIPAPLTFEVALLSRELPFNHDDPADRFLAATARAYDVPLATHDTRLIALPWLKTIQ